MILADLVRLPFMDNSFDVSICYHVLEHVPDDRQAMGELFRVLKPGAWSVLQSPVDPERETTFEDPSVTSPHERLRLFGQVDHVRVYGRDYKNRLEQVGFRVRLDAYAGSLGSSLIRRFGLPGGEELYVCSKPERGRS